MLKEYNAKAGYNFKFMDVLFDKIWMLKQYITFFTCIRFNFAK